MAESKKYYWLKLYDNFFEREEIKVIENMPGGKDYIIFYMKLLLKSIKTEGKLRFRDVIPYTPEMLSSITGTNIDTVRVAMQLFVDLKLMDLWDDKTLFMVETQNMIGSETDAAIRKRRQRQHQKELEGQGEIKQIPEKCDNVTPMSQGGHDTSQNGHTEIERETEKELEIDIELDKEREIEKSLSDKTIEILNFYQEKTCSSISAHYQLISEIAESNTVEDIKEALSNALGKGKKGKTAINYAKGILKNWAEEGKPQKKGDKNGADKQHIESADREGIGLKL